VKKPKRIIHLAPGYWTGIDENGLGARLGPLLVTGVRAKVNADGVKVLGRALPTKMREDLDDSKALVSTKNIVLGEAWARALVEFTSGHVPQTPDELYQLISARSTEELQEHCPKPARAQCFFQGHEGFSAARAEVDRLKKHLARLSDKGVRLEKVETVSICTGELNRLKAQGKNRFQADLRGMEMLLLRLRPELPGKEAVLATCGKVGGMAQYSKFFDLLGGRLHTVLGEGPGESAYAFPGLFDVSFLRDADSIDPLVMMASLVGKYVRELLMARIAHFYIEGDAAEHPSGYHDPVTEIFVSQINPRRRALKIVDSCFERERDPEVQDKKARAKAKNAEAQDDKQTSLFG
jgi:ribonuclease HII